MGKQERGGDLDNENDKKNTYSNELENSRTTSGENERGEENLRMRTTS